MDLQKDIDWIQKELDEIKDPDFIKALKDLLIYHNKTVDNQTEKDDEKNRGNS